MLAFTDGLFERRGETIDDGMRRLARSATGHSGTLEDMLTGIVAAQVDANAHDDTAILGLRWTDSGITVLLESRPSMGQIRVREPSISVRRLIETTRLTDVVLIEP